MAFKTMADLDCDTSYALGGTDKKSGKKNPVQVEGYYIGSRQVTSPKSKTGLAALHIFQTVKGNVGIWGKTNLDQKMKSVTPGVMTRVTFTGMVETKNNPMYAYRVELDKDNTIDVGAPSHEANDESTDEAEATEDGAGGYEDDVDQEEEAQDEVRPARAAAPRKPAAAPDAARQKALQDLLTKGRPRTT